MVDRVFLHCSASDRPEHDAIAVMRDWHVNNRGWKDVGYHFFIRKDGTLEAGRDLEQTPAAQRGHNAGTIAVCLHGLAKENFTTAQYATLIALSRQIDNAYGTMVSFHGHHEVAAKPCPNFPYRRILGLDEHGALTFAPTTSPETPLLDDVRRPTLQLTDTGPAVAQVQQLLHERNLDVMADGLFGQATNAAVRAFQRKNALTADGIVGPRTWAALLA